MQFSMKLLLPVKATKFSDGKSFSGSYIKALKKCSVLIDINYMGVMIIFKFVDLYFNGISLAYLPILSYGMI